MYDGLNCYVDRYYNCLSTNNSDRAKALYTKCCSRHKVCCGKPCIGYF